MKQQVDLYNSIIAIKNEVIYALFISDVLATLCKFKNAQFAHVAIDMHFQHKSKCDGGYRSDYADFEALLAVLRDLDLTVSWPSTPTPPLRQVGGSAPHQQRNQGQQQHQGQTPRSDRTPGPCLCCGKEHWYNNCEVKPNKLPVTQEEFDAGKLARDTLSARPKIDQKLQTLLKEAEHAAKAALARGVKAATAAAAAAPGAASGGDKHKVVRVAGNGFGSPSGYSVLDLVSDDNDSCCEERYSDGCVTDSEPDDAEILPAGVVKFQPNAVGYVSAAVVKAASLAASAVVSNAVNAVHAVSSAVGACVRKARNRKATMAIHPDTVCRDFTQAERRSVTKELAKQSRHNVSTLHLLQTMQILAHPVCKQSSATAKVFPVTRSQARPAANPGPQSVDARTGDDAAALPEGEDAESI